jgi:hypothetical protein
MGAVAIASMRLSRTSSTARAIASHAARPPSAESVPGTNARKSLS